MSTPEHNALDDLNHLDQVLKEDTTGERARALIVYFDEAIQYTTNRLHTQQVVEERQTTSRVIEGLKAAQRIIVSVWSVLHPDATALA